MYITMAEGRVKNQDTRLIVIAIHEAGYENG